MKSLRLALLLCFFSFVNVLAWEILDEKEFKEKHRIYRWGQVLDIKKIYEVHNFTIGSSPL